MADRRKCCRYGFGRYDTGRRTGLNLGQSDRIILFPVRQQPSVGSDLGTVELQLQPTVKILPQNPLFYQLLSYTGDVDLEAKLAEWESFYNFSRPPGAFNGKTPYEALREKL